MRHAHPWVVGVGQLQPAGTTVAALAPPVQVKSTSQVVAKVVTRATKPPVVRVTVTQAGTTPEGFVTLTWTRGSKRTAARHALTAAQGGNLKVTLPDSPPGKYTLSATYSDTSGEALQGESESTRFRIR